MHRNAFVVGNIDVDVDNIDDKKKHQWYKRKKKEDIVGIDMKRKNKDSDDNLQWQ